MGAFEFMVYPLSFLAVIIEVKDDAGAGGIDLISILAENGKSVCAIEGTEEQAFPAPLRVYLLEQ